MTNRLALAASRIFDGEQWHADAALLIDGGRVAGLVERKNAPTGAKLVETGHGFLAPGFVDLQVNGGGGVMLNDGPSVDAIGTICAAHARFGTTALLATLITDTPEMTTRAIEAGADAAAEGVPGFLGLHLEGPHLSVARKGAHDQRLIRSMTDEDMSALRAARRRMPVLLTTVAAESVTADQVSSLAQAGVTVSLGHTDAQYAAARALADAGATMVTHLFNAMSQLGNREPGLVGAALQDERMWAGLIADGYHVDPVSIAVALRAKQGPARIFLVTDAMATIGTEMTEFVLNGRVIKRQGERLTLQDGTLAGADLDMMSAIRFMHSKIGIELGEALRMASLYPAQALGLADRGRLAAGSRADVVSIGEALDVRATWIGGKLACEAG